MAFFASPGKAWLIHQLKTRNAFISKSTASTTKTTASLDESNKHTTTAATSLLQPQSQQQQQQQPLQQHSEDEEAARRRRRPDASPRSTTTDSHLSRGDDDGYGGLGLPDDPQREVAEAVEEIKGELEARQRRGSKITVPSGEEIRRMVVDDK